MGCGASTRQGNGFKVDSVASARCPLDDFAGPGSESEGVEIAHMHADAVSEASTRYPSEATSAAGSESEGVEIDGIHVEDLELDVSKWAVEYGEHSIRLPDAVFENLNDFKSMEATPTSSMQGPVRAHHMESLQLLADFLHRVESADTSQDTLDKQPGSSADQEETERKHVCRRLRKIARQ
eukprot:TRINITY_DN96810_c0_g1_i1.p1 TRINITY_DN96810_c0_g1~~TRINITY_DN96810_c0_g1_i1.p1  ORF type:complete len:181 (+),score=31.85 TRINITY_DN96810_c0_g1_i1:145-687(+)